MNSRLWYIPCLLLLAAPAVAQPAMQKKIQTDLIMVEDGATVDLPAGTFSLASSLSLQDKKNVTIRGAGVGKTVLSFKGQTEGAEGLRVTNGTNITIENMTLQDSKGDLIKTMNVDGITFRNLLVEWTGEPKTTNGSYGLYPVQCQNVQILSCTAVGASDAGIYVGQSRQIVVQHCTAWHNVAGIEIENSIGADVSENHAYENTGGILVFDLPDLVQKKGGQVRVFNNLVEHNNLDNFAPKGNIVARVPAGTGMMILATNDVEIFNNQIIDNKSLGTGIISYFITEEPIRDSLYNPYPTNIAIHDNTYSRLPGYPTRKGRMGLMFRFKLRFGKNVPDIIWDGITDDKAPAGQRTVCLKNNKNATFANIDAAHNFKAISRNAAPYTCDLPPVAGK
ncbi:parallel beta-helix domain-containing protein [Fibrella aquatilis]|uniref:Right-handed parallel beta-helix repeat-containing protein n=1 Tax=Fibrella aquatilis TaxID=2817059 RepID=A0A939GB60_9BACT|nr:parallel beta-helix domain-containing protein [Fibrella aquatilis]MBO0934019.1 right-handed parallel beta-helix repeat-containing protein [Fibrella aquatilis]